MIYKIPTWNEETEQHDDSYPNKITVVQEIGLRVILGDRDDVHAPDVLFERFVGGWRIFVHQDGGDPMAVVENRDNDKAVVIDGETEAVLLETSLSAE